MATKLGNPLKIALRKRMKDVLTSLTQECRAQQSSAITEKVLQTEAFRMAQRISIYLSTDLEVCTKQLLREMFRLDKHVYVPTYTPDSMEMVRLKDYNDYESLPLTKWNIKQPGPREARENALTNGHGIDLFIFPGVAFTLSGGRLGHGKGYYDMYIHRHFACYPHKKVTLMALAFREQILADEELPLDSHDVRLHSIMTE